MIQIDDNFRIQLEWVPTTTDVGLIRTKVGKFEWSSYQDTTGVGNVRRLRRLGVFKKSLRIGILKKDFRALGLLILKGSDPRGALALWFHLHTRSQRMTF